MTFAFVGARPAPEVSAAPVRRRLLLAWRRPGLRLPRHRATTAHLGSAYPFQAQPGLGARGVYVGTDHLAGGAAFCYDAFEFYAQGLLTNPNALVLGDVGSAKSALVKTLLYRSAGVLGSPGGLGRWVAVADPKGEYGPLAHALGLDVVRLHPGGPTRLNPLDPGPAAGRLGPHELAARRTALVGALAAAVLGRGLLPVEDAVLGWAVDHLGAHAEPTLADVARLVAAPTAEMAARAATTPEDLARRAEDLRFGLGKLLDRDLRGMFDGRSNATIDWSGRGLVLDLSAVYHDHALLRLVMIAVTAWLQALLAAPAEGEGAPRRYQVLEECWALLGSETTAKYLQSCLKLSRAYGVANVLVVHRISDLRSQADDGRAAAKVAMGLLADCQTRVLYRQPTDQVAEATELLGLSPAEAELLPQLVRGRALWKVGAGHTAVVEHRLARAEWAFCGTDARMDAKAALAAAAAA